MSNPTPLMLGSTADEERAARLVASGSIACHGFGNFYAMSTRPDADVVRYVNRIKGRPLDQVGSVTTTRPHIEALFDWSIVPPPLTRERVMQLIDHLFGRGPFGFRGPAAEHIPAHLSSLDGEVRTTQIIGAGYACRSNVFLQRCIDSIEDDFLYITSANRSHHLTGNAEEPAHWRLAELQDEFGSTPRCFMLAHASEARARAAYPDFLPMSTTILAFQRVSLADDGRPVLRLERHGSMHVDALRKAIAPLGFELELGPRALERLPLRHYPDMELAA
jgi:hypothetical protein